MFLISDRFTPTQIDISKEKNNSSRDDHIALLRMWSTPYNSPHQYSYPFIHVVRSSRPRYTRPPASHFLATIAANYSTIFSHSYYIIAPQSPLFVERFFTYKKRSSTSRKKKKLSSMVPWSSTFYILSFVFFFKGLIVTPEEFWAISP